MPPSSVSSVTRRSSRNVPSPRHLTQSPPPASTLPRRRSPSNEPPTTGKIVRPPCGIEPISSVADVARRRTISGRVPIVALISKDLVNGIDRPLRTTIAHADRHQSIQERVGGVRRLEPRQGTEVIAGRVDRFAASDRRHDFG